MKLIESEKGKHYIIQTIELEFILCERLKSLGMIPKTNIVVLNIKNSGAMILKARGTRLAVGKEITRNVEVEERHER